MKLSVCSLMLCDICLSEDQVRRRKDKLREFVTEVEDLILKSIEKFQGKVVKQIDQGLLVVFTSSTASVLCALEIHKKNVAHNYGLAEEDRIFLTTTIDTSEVTFLHNDLQGDSIRVLQKIREISLPGEILFTDATYLSMWRSKIPSARIDEHRLAHIPYAIKVHSVVNDEIDAAPILNRSLSYFGLLSRDAKNEEQTVFDAPHHTRVAAGVIDVWVGILAMLIFTLGAQAPTIFNSITKTYTLQAEDLAEESKFRGLSPWASGGSFLALKPNTTLKGSFDGPSGEYTISTSFKIGESNWKDPGVSIEIGEETYPLLRTFKNSDQFRVSILTNAVTIAHDAQISVKADEQALPTGIDYIEFIPSNVPAFRPKGVERSYRYLNFYRAIGYDDSHPYIFLLRIPAFIILALLCSLLLASTTIGGAVMGLHIVSAKTLGRIGVVSAFLRCLSWLFLPLWFWTSVGNDRQWSDVISNSRVIVRRPSSKRSLPR